MENYREKLKVDNIIIAVAAFVLALFSLLSALGEAGVIPFFVPVGGDSHWQSMWRGFLSGAACAMLAFLIFGLIRNILALKDEKKLKKLYIKQNDERQWQIYTKAMCAAMRTTLILGLVAVVVAGYFNMLVSITLLVAEFVISVMCLLFKLYYMKKF